MGLIVGIAGGTASGKTTLVDALHPHLAATGLSVTRFTLDHFFRTVDSGAPTIKLPSTGEVLPDRNHPESADHVQAADAVSAAARTADVVLIEGHLVLFLDALRAQLDLKIFVDLDDDTRAMRRMLRDLNNDRGRRDPAFIAEYYLACAKPGHDRYIAPSRSHADLIVRGDADLTRTVQLLAAAIVSLRKGA